MRATTSIFLGVIFILSIVLWYQNPSILDTIKSYVENGEFLTLEARYTPDQIKQAHKHELIADARYELKEPNLKYYPYLLMEVKFIQPNQKTREGIILWSLVDGEMVLDTQTWDKTHGFQDAITARADKDDFKIINALVVKGGVMNKERLFRELNVEPEVFNEWLEEAIEKKLVVTSGDEVRLHFQNPRFSFTPLTRINQWLVTKPYNHAQRISRNVSPQQVEKVAQAAFGDDFAVRSVKEVFLPVYTIEIQNPDGSIMTTYWNALNGKKML